MVPLDGEREAFEHNPGKMLASLIVARTPQTSATAQSNSFGDLYIISKQKQFVVCHLLQRLCTAWLLALTPISP